MVDPPGEVALPVHDLGQDYGGVDGAADAAIAAELHAEAQRPFDLAREPLWRARLVRLDATRHVLVVAGHHLVCDVTSLALVWRDLGVAYRQAAAGVGALRGSATAGYADYVAWLSRRQAEHSSADLDGWGNG